MDARSIIIAVGIALTAVLFFSLSAESMEDGNYPSEESSYSSSYHPLIEEEREEIQKNGMSYVKNEDKEVQDDQQNKKFTEKLEATTYLIGAVTASLAVNAYQRGKQKALPPTTLLVSKEEEASMHYRAGVQHIQNKLYEKAREELKMAAYLNHIDARYNLGVLYEFGLGTEVSYKKAAKWYTASMEHENSPEALKRVIRKQIQFAK
ncbi:MAG: hypothetical protein BGO67_00625 [Alphaproteobacteria bacterium 41-28]|jgi:TPR repeat protein|nr:MAG: hypothetical protein BGO67_00625 [Alphaproteobacteria bacterium 41-28]